MTDDVSPAQAAIVESALPEETAPTPAPEIVETPPAPEKFSRLRTFWANFATRWQAYLEQWPRIFLVWFLALLSLSLFVWRFAPGDAAISTYTPAQGLLIPISVFGGPAIIAFFIATHGGLEWYSNTIAAKGFGLGLIDAFLKVRAAVLRTVGLEGKDKKIPLDGVVDLPFPGLGHEGFQEHYLAKSESVKSPEVVEAIARYQLDNLGSIAINFLTVYLLIKLPTIILWEILSLALEWGVYQLGFWIARTPFPNLTLYHWELFIIENLAVALVIFFQEVKLDTGKIKLQTSPVETSVE